MTRSPIGDEPCWTRPSRQVNATDNRIVEYGSDLHVISISSGGRHAVPLGGIALSQAWLQWALSLEQLQKWPTSCSPKPPPSTIRRSYRLLCMQELLSPTCTPELSVFHHVDGALLQSLTALDNGAWNQLRAANSETQTSCWKLFDRVRGHRENV